MICLLAGSTMVPLMAGAITLAWTHSVEKIVWEEDWRSSPAGLELVEARVRGSGAGMEPPPDAKFAKGVWSWKPNLPPQAEVIMRRSGATADWRICLSGQCRPMEAYVPPAADPIVMKACEGS
ncbi:DUF1850 domain-containing protein [Microvirga tunisiensis]|jgi:hypothetical protein|uniref:DUF1850 domain-containing protein n=2 Tax=Microvirga tunisiensis TaxID=2108360 RepID=A0A5N7MDQ5_9HYPH|nr:DUF1850 domain-containing protein [Microvirga tunisiensis]MPR25003.1 DUF1850 domain-containing protein [Microvirga tunisiensis]